MELFGIVFSLPAAFLASAVYAGVLKRLPLPQPVRRAATWASAAVLCGLIAEWTLLAIFGAVECRATLGPAFFVVHTVIFFLAIPSLVNILVLKSGGTMLAWWVAVGALGAVLALPVVLTQYVVSEALYGVDGNSGPYGSR